MSDYLNPLRKANVTPERIDQGVDYSGFGPIYALGPGIIRMTSNSGWPGGAFIAEELTGGPDSGQYVYYAENIVPTAHVGQKVTAKTPVGNIGGGIEIGWAAPPPLLGESMAMKLGEASKTGDAGTGSTGEGVGFSNLIKSLGGPPGIHQPGPTKGPVPGPRGGGGTTTTTGSGGSGVFGNLGTDLIQAFLAALGVTSLTDVAKRVGFILLGGALIVLGLVALTSRQTKAIVNGGVPSGNPGQAQK